MKFTIDDIRKQFDDRGYTLVSDKYTNQKQNMEFICNKHKEEGIQNIIYRNFKYKNCGCHFCAKEKFNQIHRIDREEAKRLTGLKGLEFVDITYGEDHNKHSAIIKFICPRHRYVGIQQTTLGQMKKGLFGCNYCNFVLDTYTMKERMTERDIPFELVGEFKGNDIRTEFLCKKHMTTFLQKPRKIFEGVCGCPDCHREFLVNNKLLTKEQAQAKLNELFPSLHIVGEYINTFTPVELYCDIHECRFMCSINNYLYKGKSACCPCDSAFKGEKLIADFLVNNNYKFNSQKTYDDLRGVNNGKLSYDFYLNDYNTCIEYNGEQHYRPVNIFGGEKRFKKQLLHDNLKRQYCEINNINLIIVPYWEKENIKNFLMGEFKKINIA